MSQRRYVLLLALTLSVGSASASAVESKLWDQAASLYEGKDYKQAITRYEQLLQQEGPRAGIYYNLASCYYQLGDLGHARLYIERSLQLDPRDEAAQSNRQLIRAKSIDRLADGKGWVERTGEQMAYALPLPLLIALSLLLFALAAAAFVRFFLVRRRSARRWSFYTGLTSLALSLFTLALILHWVHEQREARQPRRRARTLKTQTNEANGLRPEEGRAAMSMFGAVDLSSFAPASKPAGPSSGASAQASSDSGGAGGSAAALVVDVDASSLRDVAELSARVPVIVVLHSPRSQVSTDLAAVLERLAGQYAGRFQVARVNVDAAPEVAQALQAQAVPTVVALIAGQPVPMFQGTVPEDQLRSILDQLLEVAAANGVSGTIAVDAAAGADARSREPEETEVERAAREALEAGDFAAAEEVYTHAIAQNPGDEELKVARNQVRLAARLDGKDPHELLVAADAEPADLEAFLAGADAALSLGDVNAALGRALEAVRTHQGEERETARLRLLEFFEIIGPTAPEVAQARRRLATMLY